MPFTVREIESPDPVTRVAAADAAVRRESDDIGEKMVLNMGPSHPATHGVLRRNAGRTPPATNARGHWRIW
jgi:NADH-quinone oxidoreductase subunit D